MRGLTPEELLIIADEVSTMHGVMVRDFGALSAVAGLSSASFYGVEVHKSPLTKGAAVAELIQKLQPLTARNDVFAAVTQRILMQLNN